MSNWQTNNNMVWNSVAAVAVGDPTRAEWANDQRENDNFMKETRAPFLRGNCQNGGGYSAGNDHGWLINVVGYVGHSVGNPRNRSIVDISEYGQGFEALPTQIDMRYRMIWMRILYADFDDEIACRAAMPNASGAGCEWLNSLGGAYYDFATWWTGAGSDDPHKHGTNPLCADFHSEDIIVYAGSDSLNADAVSDGCAPGDLILHNVAVVTVLGWYAYSIQMEISPRWAVT